MLRAYGLPPLAWRRNQIVEKNMRSVGIFALCLAALAAPVAAQDAMATPGMMAGNTVMAVMPDGHMGSMAVTDDAMAAKMMGMATPVATCTMMMTDKDGKMYMVDTSTPQALAECEKLAMTAPAM